MSQTSPPSPTTRRAKGADAFASHAAALAAAEQMLAKAKSGVRAKQAATKGTDAAQHALHGLAWLATYVEALRQMLGWARRLEAEGRARRDRAAAA